jgi:hypothetical protein
MDQAVSHRALTAEARVRSQEGQRGIWWTTQYGDKFFSEDFGFLCKHHTTCSILIHPSTADALYSRQMTPQLNSTLRKKNETRLLSIQVLVCQRIATFRLLQPSGKNTKPTLLGQLEGSILRCRRGNKKYACHIGLIRAMRPAQHCVILPGIRVNNTMKNKTTALKHALLISTSLHCPRCKTLYVDYNKTVRRERSATPLA